MCTSARTRLQSIAAVVILAATAGCATRQLTEGLTSLKGQPVSVAFTKLGYPTSEQTIAGHKVYVWSTDHFGPDLSGPGLAEYNCKIRVIITDQNIISTWDWEGNEVGCQRYAERLRS